MPRYEIKISGLIIQRPQQPECLAMPCLLPERGVDPKASLIRWDQPRQTRLSLRQQHSRTALSEAMQDARARGEKCSRWYEYHNAFIDVCGVRCAPPVAASKPDMNTRYSIQSPKSYFSPTGSARLMQITKYPPRPLRGHVTLTRWGPGAAEPMSSNGQSPIFGTRPALQTKHLQQVATTAKPETMTNEVDIPPSRTGVLGPIC